jgi:hypothetical protein
MSMWLRFGVLRVKRQKASLIRGPSKPKTYIYTCRGEGSVLTQHQSRDTETDGQRTTRDWSSGRPSAQLEDSLGISQGVTANLCTTFFTSPQRVPKLARSRRIMLPFHCFIFVSSQYIYLPMYCFYNEITVYFLKLFDHYHYTYITINNYITVRQSL